MPPHSHTRTASHQDREFAHAPARNCLQARAHTAEMVTHLFVHACRRWCDVAGDNADASKFNHRCAHAVTSHDHARCVACPAHSEPPCRTRVPRSQPACPPRWRRARGQVAELLANVTLSDLHARRHRAHPHAVARPQGVHEPGVRPLAARRASCACVRWVAAPSRVHVSVPACLSCACECPCMPHRLVRTRPAAYCAAGGGAVFVCYLHVSVTSTNDLLPL